VLAAVGVLVLPAMSNGQDLDAIVRHADMRRREYVEAFKSLTATETRVTERFDKDGALERTRTIVSDFLVYQSELKTGQVGEYRIAHEVDGKPVGDAANAIKTFQRLARSKTLEQEFERLRDANAKYALGYAAWGFTLNPLGAFRDEFRDQFECSVVGRDRIGERDVVIVSFRSKDFRPVEPKAIYRQFKQPRSGARGLVWLDGETWRARRSESETIAVADGLTTPVVLMRYEVDYGPSAFDLLTPRKIVVSFFDRSEKKTPQIRWLNARITYTYDAFKRFEVVTSSDIHLPAVNEPAEHKP
jgi:hypothetical protein